jgi:hypothetical protein
MLAAKRVVARTTSCLQHVTITRKTKNVTSFIASASSPAALCSARRRIFTEARFAIIQNSSKNHSKLNHHDFMSIIYQNRPMADIAARNKVTSAPSSSSPKKNLLLRAGSPFVLFSVLAAWVVSNAVDGKLREREVSQGRTSVSVRQDALEKEHEEIMERLGTIVNQDFDNTKRIKRPHEILEERKKERARRNAWHRRAYRAVFGGGDC